jgi:radical SAM protein with 4Fe4S-binding SPASM domain
VTPSFRPAWGSHFSQEDIAACKSRGGLLSMELECSRVCNLRCIYCYSSAGAPLEDELRWEELQSVLDQAQALGARRIIVLGGGEPLAWGRIRELLRSIHARGLAIDLFTNGTLITADLARELFQLGTHPVIKMNSLDQEVQDTLAGHQGAFEAIRRGLGHLLEAGYPTPDMPLGVQTVVCRQNLPELPALWTWIRERSLTPYFEMLTLQGRAREHLDLLVSPVELRTLFEELARIDAERYGLHWLPRPPIAGLSCQRHEYTCTVTVQGDVLPCPGVNIPVGNIRQAPLAEVLRQSQVIRDLRDIRRTIKGACKTCELAHECYGCRGMAYQATGDYLAPDPLCWRANGTPPERSGGK